MPDHTAPAEQARALTEAALRRMPKRDYMNRRQQMFFRQRLLAMREKIEVDLATYRLALQSDERQPDDFDLASAEEDRRYLLRTIERNIGLLKKVDGALRRLATGDYGYCLESGEPIGIERLLARPTAEYSIDVKARQESRERHYVHHRS